MIYIYIYVYVYMCVCMCVCAHMCTHGKLLHLCLTLCGLSVSSVHGILQAIILEWVAMASSRGLSWPRDWIQVSCTAGRFFIIRATREIHISAYSFIIEYGRPYCLIIRNSFPFPLLREPQHCSKSTFLQSHVLQKSVCIPNPRSELAVV